MERIKDLLWLKWKLTKNSYRADSRGILLSIIGTLFPLALFSYVSFQLYKVLTILPPGLTAELLFYCFTLMYIVLLTSQIFGFTFVGDYDISKLFVYPISYKTIFLSGILTSFLDVWSLIFFIPPFLAVMFVFSTGFLQSALIFLAMLLFLVHSFGLSQIIIGLLYNILKSRRFRDISMIVGFLGGAVIYILIRFAGELNLQSVLELNLSYYFGFLPSKILANLVINLQENNFLPVSLQFSMLFIFCVLTIFVGGALTKTTYYNVTGISRAKRNVKNKNDLLRLPVSEQVNAVFSKDLKCLLRDPQRKMLFLMPLFLFVVLFLQREVPSFILFFLGGFTAYFMSAQLSINILGYEGGGLPTLLGSPINRKDIILGKNLVAFTVISSVLLVVLTIASIILHTLNLLVYAVLISEAVVILTISAGNIFSIYFPFRPKIIGIVKKYTSFGASMGFMFACFVLFAPVFLGLLLSAMRMPHLLFIVVFSSVVYSVLIYYIILKIATDRLEKKEIEIVQKYVC